ncbi:MAG: hypothetical protein WBZ36_06065 [Candidatus Nitrosopolaris sp.]
MICLKEASKSYPLGDSYSDQVRNRLFGVPPDTVSVINGISNTNLGHISVGHHPSAIGVFPLYFGAIIYVANAYDNTVSGINGTSNTNLGHISVGHHPSAIGVDDQL